MGVAYDEVLFDKSVCYVVGGYLIRLLGLQNEINTDDGPVLFQETRISAEFVYISQG